MNHMRAHDTPRQMRENDGQKSTQYPSNPPSHPSGHVPVCTANDPSLPHIPYHPWHDHGGILIVAERPSATTAQTFPRPTTYVSALSIKAMPHRCCASSFPFSVSANKYGQGQIFRAIEACVWANKCCLDATRVGTSVDVTAISLGIKASVTQATPASGMIMNREPYEPPHPHQCSAEQALPFAGSSSHVPIPKHTLRMPIQWPLG